MLRCHDPDGNAWLLLEWAQEFKLKCRKSEKIRRVCDAGWSDGETAAVRAAAISGDAVENFGCQHCDDRVIGSDCSSCRTSRS